MNIFTLNNAVKKNINQMIKGDVFYVELDKDKLWDTYLSSFPEGTNPIYKERTEHDCNCCKQFVKGVGSMVSIENGQLKSVWDIDIQDGVFQVVADALSEFVKQHEIAGLYQYFQTDVGVARNVQEFDSGEVIQWNHLHVKLPQSLVLNNGQSLGNLNSDVVANYDVLKRSLTEISEEAIEIVLDLIDQNSLYRGEEHKRTVTTLLEVKREYNSAQNKDLFLWEKSVKLGHASRFKNTVIGTLLDDISQGVDLEKAVKSFESKVAPSNYKRPKALITQKMINSAQDKVKELDLTDSLSRRYAKTEDISVNNVLFADRSSKKVMKDVFDELKPTAKSGSKSFDKVEEVSIEHFVEKILPKAESLEILVENKHTSNLFSLIAPEYDAAESLFKWNNGFSWTYNGEVADSIKERVKKAGGNVEGDVRASLSWFNYDDLDIHVKEPDGREIYFSNKISNRTGGKLDIDMNAGYGHTREAVENIFWKDKSRMIPGDYQVIINNFAQRETKNVGFEVELDILGDTRTYSYDQAVGNRSNISVVTFNVDKSGDISVKKEHLPSSKKSKELWNISTENFQKVNMVMLSPNHWDDLTIGNKHYFFVLEGCTNPENARGFYNEFLREDLTQHRKVFEVLASKMKCDYTENQLSGVGFSSTVKNEFVCKVSGSFNRTIKVKI